MDTIVGKMFNQGNKHRMHNFPGVPSNYYFILESGKRRKCTADEYFAENVRKCERVSIGGTSHFSISGGGKEYITGEVAQQEFERLQKLPVE